MSETDGPDKKRSMHPATTMAPTMVLASLLITAGLLAGPAAAFLGDTNVAVFWGRNKDEGTLREACDTGLYNVVVISFLSIFGHGTYELDLSGHRLAGIGDDITHCQRTRGILVLLAIGGSGGEYSLPSSQSAADLAHHLWYTYLGGARAEGRPRHVVPRPFGDAVVDGIDFFIDQGSTEHYDELARHLSSYNKHYHGRLGVTLTATVRCAYPDQRIAAALATGLFSRIHVRLYGDMRCTWSARESWEKWAAAYPGSAVFVAVAASPEADRDAYMSQKDLYYGVLQFAEKRPNFGGVVIWDRYYDKKTGYTAGSPIH